MINSYLKNISEIAFRGDAREESYYSTLEKLLKEYAQSTGRTSIHITTLPKKTEAGNPDFRVWDGSHHIAGYLEAKDPSVEDLNRIEGSDQLNRYLHTFPNIILTNFFEFRLYRHGKLIDKVQIARPFIARSLKVTPPAEKAEEFFNFLDKFFSFTLPQVFDAKSLAVELAKRTRFLRDEVIAEELKEEERNGKGFVIGFYEAFKQYLVAGLSKEDFADLYSQTITYGLFAARTRSQDGFNRKLAYDTIPHTIGILRDVFEFVSRGKLPPQMEWIIDDISEVLALTDVKRILHKYFHEGKGKDPIVHFYETFLAEYDPKTREKRGVYYTPEPVVSYIVRSLNVILKQNFDIPDGFADENVTLLDPAAGTLTFMAEAAKLAVDEFMAKYGEGGKELLLREHILRNFYAFELMMAPYAIGHLKMSFLLEELGYELKEDERFNLYLTNSLEMEELPETQLPGMASLSEESHLAGRLKKEQPILVIMGNPPYSYHSLNTGKWISKEIRAYYQIDGKPLGEKNPKGLQDDYVKFIRFAQWKIDKAGEGLLGFITNHGFLDNPTFRGMRQSLMASFNEMYLLDLHGNSLKKEKCPDGSKDENVFDIMQGVTIAIFIKRKGKRTECKVHHAEIWGLRENKYDWLLKNDIKTTKWNKLSPKSEFYLLIPRDEELLKSYEKYPKITEIFPLNNVGILTSRDGFVIDMDKESLKRRIGMFCNENMPDELIRDTFHLKDTSVWTLKSSRQNIRKDRDWEGKITQILYRPFDIRWIFYHDDIVERSRKEVMQHMLKDNLALILPKRVETKIPWAHILCSRNIVEHVAVSLKTIDYLFPLYLYPETNKPTTPKKRSLGAMAMLFEPSSEYAARKPNLNPAIVEQLAKDFGKQPSPEEIFYYVYAVLYSNTYRTMYADFLKMDFPRIPFTGDYKLFRNMSEYGQKLVELHLLKSTEIGPPVAKCQGNGNFMVEKIRYYESEGLVYFNPHQYFEGILPTVWEYRIGGYQVCEKWLKDRKGKMLSLEETKHYCRIVTALQKTRELQAEIDGAFAEISI